MEYRTLRRDRHLVQEYDRYLRQDVSYDTSKIGSEGEYTPMMVRRRCAIVNNILWPNSSRIVVWILEGSINIEKGLFKENATHLASVSKSTYKDLIREYQLSIVADQNKLTDAVDSSMIMTLDLRNRLFAICWLGIYRFEPEIHLRPCHGK